MRTISLFLLGRQNRNFVGMKMYACEEEDIKHWEAGRSLTKDWFLKRRAVENMTFINTRYIIISMQSSGASVFIFQLRLLAMILMLQDFI